MTSDEKLQARIDAAQREMYEREKEMIKAREEYDRARRTLEDAQSELLAAFYALKLYRMGVK